MNKKLLEIALWVIVVLEASYLFYDIFSAKAKENTGNANWFEVGNLDDFQPGNVYPFVNEKFYLSVLEDGGMLAISTKCTHLGCSVEHKAEGFLCPCHGSEFDKYGMVTEPPATRALDIYPIKIKDGKIFVDLAHPVKRKKFEKSQLTYANR